MATPKRSPAPVSPKPSTLTIDVSPSEETREALALRQQATALVVVDRETHANALEFIRTAKSIQRKIEERWSKITRGVDDFKKNLLNMKREDLAPVEAAIANATTIALTYENAEKRRAAEEQDRVRREAEQQAQADRDREQAALEQAALKAEAGSTDLSPRERTFVDYITGPYRDASRAAQQAGYKDFVGQAARLLATPKIVKAIAAARQAKELRDQAAAKREQPLDVVVPKVEAELGKAAGVSTRTTYSCGEIDLAAFNAAVLAGTISTDYILPNGPKLNEAARNSKELFPQAFPGCALKTNQGIAG